ncbi:hypothetical protein ACSQ67_002252 [Phaseolus vulgaris]
MPMLRPRIITIIIFTLLLPLTSATTTATEPCRFSFLDGDHLYNYTLSSPIRNFPHGILSEDGIWQLCSSDIRFSFHICFGACRFYKVAVNETTLWFQLCDGMVFNHDPPVCADCWDCGGPNRCGTQCNALVANKVGGRIPDISVFSHLLVFVHKLSPVSTAYACGSGGVKWTVLLLCLVVVPCNMDSSLL